jgi:acetylornithine deacetylase
MRYLPHMLADQLDTAVEVHAEAEFKFLSDLVSKDSSLGNEDESLQILGERLSDIGMEVQRLPIDPNIAEDALAGVAQGSYAGRSNLLAGNVLSDEFPSLLINCHIDVVPAKGPAWGREPFEPIRVGDRLYGRGAGDMKGGIVTATLALQAISSVAPEFLSCPLALLAVIEEECTGNGTLAALRAGIDADAVLLPEPTNLELLLGGVGILWLKVLITTRGGHAEAADQMQSPARLVRDIIDQLATLEHELNLSPTDPFSHITSPYNINIGKIRSGDWASSVPSWTSLEIRIGFPSTYRHEDIGRMVEKCISDVVVISDDVTLAVSPSGFRAEGYYLEPTAPLAMAFAKVSQQRTGKTIPTTVMGSTTDARYYVNHGRGQALCYGPKVGNMHGVDEYVELSSIVEAAKQYACFMVNYFAGRGLDGMEQEQVVPNE